jgi:hypothetical protein
VPRSSLVSALGAGLVEGIAETTGLTSALISGDSIAGLSETTGTLALGVGVAVLVPQPASSVAATAAESTAARTNLFILHTSKSF